LVNQIGKPIRVMKKTSKNLVSLFRAVLVCDFFMFSSSRHYKRRLTATYSAFLFTDEYENNLHVNHMFSRTVYPISVKTLSIIKEVIQIT